MGFALVEIRQPMRKPLVVAVSDLLEIGRDCDGLLLTDPEVSRRHVALEFKGDALIVNDLGSTNGTTLNGSLLEGPMPVTEADVVRVGGTEIQLLRQAASAEGAAPLTAVPGVTGTPRGTVITGTGTGTGDQAVVKGRADDTAARRTSIDAVAAAVDEEHPNVAQLAGDGGTITIVFSDIESSTEMAIALGDAKWVALLRTHNEIIRRHLKRYKGTEIKSQGDGFMLTFPSARAAVQCMIDVQRELAVYAIEHPQTPVRVRIGLHTGEAIVDAGGDLFGKHIIVAARIANIADGGQILASAITKEIASSRGDLHFGERREVSLKGIDDNYQIYEVIWNNFAARAHDIAR
jgi:adenylate cyclase